MNLSMKNILKEMISPDLSYLLKDPGDVPQIGNEKGTKKQDGISRYISPHGSYRYVYYMQGKPISALQVVKVNKGFAKIANVWTEPDFRRRKYAEKLLQKARLDFSKIEHSSDLSATGKSWASKVG